MTPANNTEPWMAAVSTVEYGDPKTEADLLLDDVRGWLRADEHAVAGGLAAKLSESVWVHTFQSSLLHAKGEGVSRRTS